MKKTINRNKEILKDLTTNPPLGILGHHIMTSPDKRQRYRMPGLFREAQILTKFANRL